MSRSYAPESMRSRMLGDGVELVETNALKGGYAPHSHDSYVVGFTSHGVQQFRYRGTERYALPGQAFVLHPDELHDGRPGTDDGYGYRSIYIDPGHIANAVGGATLPFVREPVSSDTALRAAIARLLGNSNESSGDLPIVEALADLAEVLQRNSGQFRREPSLRYDALRRIREQLHSDWRSDIRMADLEAEHGLSRYVITRQFHRHFGVSPSRYLVLRRLDHAKRLIAGRQSLAEVAAASGFSDQSHMTRHFLRAFGMTPGRWRALNQQGSL